MLSKTPSSFQCWRKRGQQKIEEEKKKEKESEMLIGIRDAAYERETERVWGGAGSHEGL